MIGKPGWFTKKSFGIGIRPKTWQGWTYILLAITLILFTRWQPFWSWTNQARNTITIILAVVVVLDSIHIMFILNKDNKDSE